MNSSSSSPKDDAAITADVGSESNRNSSTRESSSSSLVPQLGGITEEDLTTAIRVLDAISSLDPKNGRRKHNFKQKKKQQKRKCDEEETTSDGASGQAKDGNDVNGDVDDGGGGDTDYLPAYRFTSGPCTRASPNRITSRIDSPNGR